MAELHCIVVTPESTVLDQQADFVALPLYDGEMGILPGHSPLIGRLGFGELRLRTGNQQLRYYIDGGFVQVASNTVSLLTNRAVPADQLDAQAARQQLEAAQQRPAHSPELLEVRDRLIQQARAQLRMAKS